MKRIDREFFIGPVTGFLAAIFLNSCEQPKLAVPEVEPVQELVVEEKKPSLLDEAPLPMSVFPVERTLINQKGQELHVAIIGRDVDSIIIIRKSDRKEYSLPIDMLGADDQKYCKRLPYIRPKKTKQAKKEKEKEDPYVANREKDIKKLQEERQDLGSSLAGETNQMTVRNKSSKIEKLTQEINRLQTQIDQHQRN